MRSDIFENPRDKFITAKIAVNNDSLNYWLLADLVTEAKKKNILLDISTEDESKTLEQLLEGKVFAAISSLKSAGPIYHSQKIGVCTYRLLAAKSFAKKYFKNGLSRESILDAPYIFHNRNDYISYNFLEKHFDILSQEIETCHFLPSVLGLEKAVLKGLGFCLLPDFTLTSKIKTGHLIDLAPDFHVYQDLYLHTWKNLPPILQDIADCIIDSGQRFLSQEK